MRGKELAKLFLRHLAGITPAHAGKRGYDKLPCGQYRDHPRPCGEKIDTSKYVTRAEGSPPPMRGKVLCRWHLRQHCGITPAHAGKRRKGKIPQEGDEDHPRPCGEKMWRMYEQYMEKGSPPPMRGKGRYPRVNYPAVRITPAHAGKSKYLGTDSNVTGITPAHAGKR